nr:RNA-directed DNA polymerase, eukaryota, reverse transcriptase zinc-binding domain protein [Tanacetum cinerariifolium]
MGGSDFKDGLGYMCKRGRPQKDFPTNSSKELYTPSFDPEGVVYEDLSNRKRLMRAAELRKFSNGTLKKNIIVILHSTHNDDGNPTSSNIKQALRVLDEFSMSSGLYPIMSKSNAFFCNIPSNVKDKIKLVMPFSKGDLPIRYLGVPLVAKRIAKNDCRVLIKIVQNKPVAQLDTLINNWASVILGWVNRPAKNTIWSVVQRLVFGAAIYFIWHERNIRRVELKERSIDMLFRVIIENIRFKLMGLKLKCTSDVMKVAKAAWIPHLESLCLWLLGFLIWKVYVSGTQT